jgi:type I restriction enzyme S subunit
MQSDDLRSQIESVAGQTDMAPYVSLRDQRAMEVPIFDRSQAALSRRLDVLLHRQALADEEGKTLAALRDTLLPRLVSGELRVKDAEPLAARLV